MEWNYIMLNKDEIIKILNDENNFVDNFILDAFIKNWKIEAIYEDENGVEFYDEAAFEKIKSALGNKPQEKEIYTVETVSKEELKEDIEEVVQEIAQEVVQEVVHEVIGSTKPQVAEVIPKQETELKNVTLDITNQTLNVLAHTIAEKITGDISGYLKNNEWLEEALNAGSFKRDNEILSAKLNEVLQDNKIFIKRIQELEKENKSYLNVVANIYVKKSK